MIFVLLSFFTDKQTL